ncbi:MAG: ATPase, partial [Hyphomicrobiaceae bacterium]
FYHAVSVVGGENGFLIALDGRPARTPGKALLASPTRRLADAIAAEWAAQEGSIDPRTMPITRLMNSAIDHVASRLSEVIADIVRYAGSDLICYRAEAPGELMGRQGRAWDPVLAWAKGRLGVCFSVTRGVMPVEQSAEAVAAVGRAIEGRGQFEVAALHVMTSLLGSVLLAIAHAEGLLSTEAAWCAAHVDEDWQAEQWGSDADAAARKAYRLSEFEAASLIFKESAGR